mmetsp:Transcript_22241/g.33091  ORF Transcript_22241/g.33091 Transcript_22241/m.33091 type:complete len:220 (+) Transcript_22241:5322-5981(+)
MDFETHFFNLPHESIVTALIDLTAHENGCEFDNMRFDTHILDCLGSFETQQSTADDCSTLNIVVLDIGQHGFKVFNRSVDKNPRSLLSRNRGNKGIGSCRQNGNIIIQHFARFTHNLFLLRINALRLVSNQNVYIILIVPCRFAIIFKVRCHGKGRWISCFKVGSKTNTIVGCSWFFTKGRYRTILLLIEFQQILHESLSDHTISNHNDFFLFVLGMEL